MYFIGKKMNGILLKIYFKKANNKVNWSFLQQALRMKGFDHILCHQVNEYIS
jgi:hypothetical protein